MLLCKQSKWVPHSLRFQFSHLMAISTHALEQTNNKSQRDSRSRTKMKDRMRRSGAVIEHSGCLPSDVYRNVSILVVCSTKTSGMHVIFYAVIGAATRAWHFTWKINSSNLLRPIHFEYLIKISIPHICSDKIIQQNLTFHNKRWTHDNRDSVDISDESKRLRCVWYFQIEKYFRRSVLRITMRFD